MNYTRASKHKTLQSPNDVKALHQSPKMAACFNLMLSLPYSLIPAPLYKLVFCALKLKGNAIKFKNSIAVTAETDARQYIL